MWRDLVSEWLVWSVIEAVWTMLIGMALSKWGISQGQRDRGFYLRLLIGCYAIGFTLRGVGLAETLSFSPVPRTIWFTAEVARLALGLGHVSLINLAVQTRFGSGLLRPRSEERRVGNEGFWTCRSRWSTDL